jgi:Uma2 family endonuclease
MAIARQRMTLDEFLKLPEEEPSLELFDGQIVQKSVGDLPRSATLGEVCTQLHEFARPRRLGRVFLSLRTSYAGTSTVPDIVYFVSERIPRDASGELLSDIFIAPDIAVEIVSPEQSVTDLLVRCLWYVANGVRIALLIDPGRRSVILFRPGAEPIALRETGSLDLGDVIPGFVLDVADLFAELKRSN